MDPTPEEEKAYAKLCTRHVRARYAREHYHRHQDAARARGREYYARNKEAIKARTAAYQQTAKHAQWRAGRKTCECGADVSNQAMSRHRRTDRHARAMAAK
jgi:hypothetical protein